MSGSGETIRKYESRLRLVVSRQFLFNNPDTVYNHVWIIMGNVNRRPAILMMASLWLTSHVCVECKCHVCGIEKSRVWNTKVTCVECTSARGSVWIRGELLPWRLLTWRSYPTNCGQSFSFPQVMVGELLSETSIWFRRWDGFDGSSTDAYLTIEQRRHTDRLHALCVRFCSDEYS